MKISPCLLLLLFFQIVLSGSIFAKDISKDPAVHPYWASRKEFFSDDYQSITLIGSDLSTEKVWKQWIENVGQLFYRKKVKSVFLNQGYVSKWAIEYLSNFENIETITLGASIEGVIISPEAFWGLRKFKKLKFLNTSIHGLRDEHFQCISKISNLEELAIEFPSVHMVAGGHDIKKWSRVDLTDQSIYKILDLKSLAYLRVMDGPGRATGDVKLTGKALEILSSSSNIESIRVSVVRNFADGELEKIRKRTLSSKIVIY